ncbi:MAG: dodecin domain-containing protein [Alphaproteobacteria bacterium]|nr:dodecin domain-containing protein [Alphaproteobacteria bacterium]
MSVYRVTEIIGSSEKSWEDAAKQALSAAAGSLRDLRVAEVVEQDIALDDAGKVQAFRTKLRVSFKYDPQKEGAAAPKRARR